MSLKIEFDPAHASFSIVDFSVPMDADDRHISMTVGSGHDAQSFIRALQYLIVEVQTGEALFENLQDMGQGRA